ncbi:MAG TPA: type II toxin-antitoxin system prevent-host-death family antitoxin [Rhizomicrobium sp.]|jgi:prevent-host-death family protein|nr:type II toxin-antitoxin system prevent-host-death family antitoxin [Rhizomicrobium sp.]
MTTVNIKDAKNRLSELGRKAEAGETVTVTRNGKPVFDIVPHKRKRGGTDWEAGERYMREHGIETFFGEPAPDWDDPLPADFLLTPLPSEYGRPKPQKK